MAVQNILKEKLYQIALDKAQSLGYEVVNFVFAGHGKRYLLKITIDKPTGSISIDDCEKMSRAVEAVIDVQDLIESPYTLEVTSPGLDRPLLKPEDYHRHRGYLARISLKEAINSKTFLIGRIIDSGDNWVRIKEQIKPTLKGAKAKSTDEGADLIIPFDKISKARLEVEI